MTNLKDTVHYLRKRAEEVGRNKLVFRTVHSNIIMQYKPTKCTFSKLMVVKELTFTQTTWQISHILFTLLATILQGLISSTIPPTSNPPHRQVESRTVTVPGSLPATHDTVGSETLLPTLASESTHTGYPEITNTTPGDTSIEGADVKIRRLYVCPPNYKMLENDSRFFTTVSHWAV